MWTDQARLKFQKSAWPGSLPGRLPGAWQAPGLTGSSDLDIFKK